TGLRTVELVRANVGDIGVLSGRAGLFVHGKGRSDKSEWVKIPESTVDALNDYLAIRGNIKDGAPLFVSLSNNNRNQRLSTRTISNVVKEGLTAVGLNSRSLTAHSLRHTTATMLLEAGMSLEPAQWALRHVSSATTAIYTQTIKSEMRLSDDSDLILNDMIAV